MNTFLRIASLLTVAALAPAFAEAAPQAAGPQPDAAPREQSVVLSVVNSQLLKYLSFAPANSTPYVAVFILNGKADGYRVNITYVGLADGQPHLASQDVPNGHVAYFAVDAVTVTAAVSPYMVSMQSITASVP